MVHSPNILLMNMNDITMVRYQYSWSTWMENIINAMIWLGLEKGGLPKIQQFRASCSIMFARERTPLIHAEVGVHHVETHPFSTYVASEFLAYPLVIKRSYWKSPSRVDFPIQDGDFPQLCLIPRGYWGYQMIFESLPTKPPLEQGTWISPQTPWLLNPLARCNANRPT